MKTTPYEGSQRRLRFRRLPEAFAVCRFAAEAPVPGWATQGAFSSISRSADELSIVCSADRVPDDCKTELRWICFKLEGPFAFSEVGVLVSFLAPLAKSGVGIFAVSTYDTDYVLVREEHAGAALEALQAAGHELITAA